MSDMNKILVVGAGLMGAGIAQVSAQAGLDVFLHDLTPEALENSLNRIAWSVGKLVHGGKVQEEKDVILGRIRTVVDFSHAADADMVVEAIFEKRDLKEEIFGQLDRVCKPEAILASNTSAIPITNLASATNRPDRVAGLHFFNPVPLLQVVEVIKGISTSEETMRSCLNFIARLGKEPIRVESDVPGFLLNRINLVSYVEAIRLVEQGIGKIEEIDHGIRMAFGRRMGPFETGDMVGLDVSHGALMAIYDESKDDRYYPPRLLRRKVAAGQLGRKTGSGWYEYNPDGSRKG